MASTHTLTVMASYDFIVEEGKDPDIIAGDICVGFAEPSNHFRDGIEHGRKITRKEDNG